MKWILQRELNNIQKKQGPDFLWVKCGTSFGGWDASLPWPVITQVWLSYCFVWHMNVQQPLYVIATPNQTRQEHKYRACCRALQHKFPTSPAQSVSWGEIAFDCTPHSIVLGDVTRCDCDFSLEYDAILDHVRAVTMLAKQALIQKCRFSCGYVFVLIRVFVIHSPVVFNDLDSESSAFAFFFFFERQYFFFNLGNPSHSKRDAKFDFPFVALINGCSFPSYCAWIPGKACTGWGTHRHSL